MKRKKTPMRLFAPAEGLSLALDGRPLVDLKGNPLTSLDVGKGQSVNVNISSDGSTYILDPRSRKERRRADAIKRKGKGP